MCGEVKPLSEFYTYKYKGRKYTRGFCNACDLRKRRERYREKHPGGLTYDRDTGKLWLRKGRGRSLVWTSQMLSDLRRLFARTKNEELAGILGVGVRTMVRKARELGLEKDDGWLSGVWDDNRKMAHMMSRAKGYPGGYKPGRPDTGTEWRKGYVMPEESRRKQAASMRRYAMAHKSDYRRRGLKAWETRRRRAEENGTQA